jgi:hypothetical protein
MNKKSNADLVILQYDLSILQFDMSMPAILQIEPLLDSLSYIESVVAFLEPLLTIAHLFVELLLFALVIIIVM